VQRALCVRWRPSTSATKNAKSNRNATFPRNRSPTTTSGRNPESTESAIADSTLRPSGSLGSAGIGSKCSSDSPSDVFIVVLTDAWLSAWTFGCRSRQSVARDDKTKAVSSFIVCVRVTCCRYLAHGRYEREIDAWILLRRSPQKCPNYVSNRPESGHDFEMRIKRGKGKRREARDSWKQRMTVLQSFRLRNLMRLFNALN